MYRERRNFENDLEALEKWNPDLARKTENRNQIRVCKFIGENCHYVERAFGMDNAQKVAYTGLICNQQPDKCGIYQLKTMCEKT